MSTLTAKQERFCQEIVKGNSQSDAYRVAFDLKTMSKKTINEKACRLAKRDKIRARVNELRAPVVAQVQGAMADRLKELSYAMFLDPAECFDEHGIPLSILKMPERARRAIASYEVDTEKFVTKIRFIDKLAAIMHYSKLAGDIPTGESPPAPPIRDQYDRSKLTNEEWETYKRILRKALVGPDTVRHASG